MVTGYRVVLKIENEPPGITKRASRRALDLSTMELIRNLKINSPVDQGKLQGSWFRTANPGTMTRRVKSSAKYAQDVNDGTGIYGPKGTVIRPRVKKVLRFEYKGKIVFARYVKGQKGQKFVEKSIVETQKRNDEFIIRAVMETNKGV